MANREYFLQRAKDMGLRTLSMSFPESHVNPLITAEERNRLRRRWTPQVQRAMRVGLEKFALGAESFDPIGCYQGVVEYQTAAVFGEKGIDAIDWGKPPRIDVPEHRYLAVLSKLAKTIQSGDYGEFQLITRGLTSYYGSNADSGGFPCNPEVLFTVMTVESNIQKVLQVVRPTEREIGLGHSIANQIEETIVGYSLGERLQVMNATIELCSITEDFLKHRRIEQQMARIHPALGQLAHAYLRIEKPY